MHKFLVGLVSIFILIPCIIVLYPIREENIILAVSFSISEKIILLGYALLIVRVLLWLNSLMM